MVIAHQSETKLQSDIKRDISLLTSLGIWLMCSVEKYMLQCNEMVIDGLKESEK